MEVENPSYFGELIAQGAEAKIYRTTFLGRPTIIKERFPKSYRIAFLDTKINSGRISTEAKTLARVRSVGLDAPAIYHVDVPNLRIFMELIDGLTVKETIFQSTSALDSPEMTKLANLMGTTLAKLHSNNIIHGDLTTSNFMIRKDSGTLVTIDFGLSFVSSLVEDKAVDLYVLERAFSSLHPNSECMFEKLIEAYNSQHTGSKQVLHRLEKVRQRGRKKIAFG
jgi:TP53 regulating kinase-like protein